MAIAMDEEQNAADRRSNLSEGYSTGNLGYQEKN